MKTVEIVYVSMTCLEQDIQKFSGFLLEIARDVRLIEGCIKFDYLNSPESPNRFVAYLEFDSKESHQRYKSSEAVGKINRWLFPLLSHPPDFRHYSAELVQSS
ncbi:antibiotic biosynthesis monooxygenase [Flavobacterium sp. DGU38]|uniref:Antibiotic biosynthesis monooxygenase n=1 Tax=Flavobacterium calami TaxID=3139144 RepID=A0ABU9IQZ9_9FLAO